MSASIAVTPAAPDHGNFVRVDVSGADENDSASYDDTLYPTEPEFRYYLTFELDSAILGKSYVFGVNSDGDHTFNNYVFPASGSWTVRLNDASDDSSVATASVTVS